MLLNNIFDILNKSEEVFVWGDNNKPLVKVRAAHIIWYKKIANWNNNYISQLKNSNETTNVLIKNVRNAMAHEIKKSCQEAQRKGFNARLIFPPLKPKGLSMCFLSSLISEDILKQAVIVKSDAYSLHNQPDVPSRVMVLEKHYPNWELHDECIPLSNKDFYIFIDDVFTSGTTAKFIYKFINKNRSEHGIGELPIKTDRFVDGFEVIALSRKYSPSKAVENKNFVKILNKKLSEEVNAEATK